MSERSDRLNAIMDAAALEIMAAMVGQRQPDLGWDDPADADKLSHMAYCYAAALVRAHVEWVDDNVAGWDMES